MNVEGAYYFIVIYFIIYFFSLCICIISLYRHTYTFTENNPYGSN